jgi:hypothetical protein
MTRSLARFSDLLEAQGFARINAWTLEERRTILSELDSLSRLEFLMTELDRYLPAVTWPAAEPTRRSDQSRSIPATSAD